MRRLAALAAVALSWTALAEAPSTKPEAELARQQAIMTRVKLLVLQHKATEALPLVEQIIAEGDARAATEKRRVYSGQTMEMVLANMLTAAADKTGAVDFGPPYGEALFYKGFALVDIGRGGEAGVWLDRAVKVSPSNAQFLCEDASWHAGHHELDLALDLYKSCRDHSGLMREGGRTTFDAAGLRGQGFVLIEQGKLDEAEAIYNDRLKADPTDAKAQNELRYIRQQRAKAERAKT